MFTWNHQHTVTTTASPAQIWQVWSNPAAWPIVDPGIEAVTLAGPFSSGTTGTLRPTGGPTFRFRLMTVTDGHGFRDRTFLPLTWLDFIHAYEPATADQPARITYRIEMRGWLTPLFRRVIGSGIVRDLATNMRGLAQHAENLAAA